MRRRPPLATPRSGLTWCLPHLGGEDLWKARLARLFGENGRVQCRRERKHHAAGGKLIALSHLDCASELLESC